MPNYRDIDENTDYGRRTLERLLALRKELADKIPKRTLHENLLIATWNIRDFDKPTFGSRMEESIRYIAEIISHFDIVAVQEVYKDLTALKRVMEVLGPDWKYIVTDETISPPDSKKKRGNDERLAFVYHARKIDFGGLAGEMVLPSIEDANGDLHPVTQIWRTPFIVGLRSGFSPFMLATVHILWGGDDANPAERVEEIRQVAQFLKKRTNDTTAWARNLILLGDFNIFDPQDETFKQLLDAGFVVPLSLQETPSNAKKVRHYDQIAFRIQKDRLEPTGEAGVFDYYEVVFRDTPEDKAIYMPYMVHYDIKPDGNPRSDQSKKNYYQTYWRTHQMSDHLPMWVELKIDYSDEYLERKLAGLA